MIKFVRIESDRCIRNFPDRNVPTILVYSNGDMQVQLVGGASVGGKGASAKDVERILRKAGGIPQSVEPVSRWDKDRDEQNAGDSGDDDNFD